MEGRDADECRIAELYREIIAVADAQEAERQVRARVLRGWRLRVGTVGVEESSPFGVE